MTQMKHTPGPWVYEAIDAPGSRLVTVAYAGDYRIGVDSGRKGGNYRDANYGADEADARLIAAAPALFEALRLAAKELVAIRARDGAPQYVAWNNGQPIQICACDPEWWSELTDKCLSALALASEETP